MLCSAPIHIHSHHNMSQVKVLLSSMPCRNLMTPDDHSLRNIRRSNTFSSPSTNRPNSLRGRHTNNRPCSRRGRLSNRPRGPHANRDIRIAPPLLALDHHIRVSHTAHGQAGGDPGFVVVIESDGPTAAIRSADAEVLAQVTVVFGPELVLRAVAGVVAVEGVAGVVRGVVFGEGVHDVEFYAGVTREAVEGHVRVALGIVVCSVVDDADLRLAV
jgi:hypothetical protein